VPWARSLSRPLILSCEHVWPSPGQTHLMPTTRQHPRHFCVWVHTQTGHRLHISCPPGHLSGGERV
jgi:hypothetical protein